MFTPFGGSSAAAGQALGYRRTVKPSRLLDDFRRRHGVCTLHVSGNAWLEPPESSPKRQIYASSNRIV